MRIVCLILLAALLSGCGRRAEEPLLYTVPERSVAPSETAAEEPIPDDPGYYINNVYPDQLREYYEGLARGWKAEDYETHGRSPLGADFRKGDPLENVGFLLEDLDGDGVRELLIGAIRGAEESPLIFELWTLLQDEPRQVLRAEREERYFLLEGDAVIFARETGEDPPLRRRAYRGGAFTAADVEAAPIAYKVPKFMPFCLYDP